MSFDHEVRQRLERCRMAKINDIERELRDPVSMKFSPSIAHAIHELRFPSNPKFTPLSSEQIAKDLEDLGLHCYYFI